MDLEGVHVGSAVAMLGLPGRRDGPQCPLGERMPVLTDSFLSCHRAWEGAAWLSCLGTGDILTARGRT